MPQNRRIAPVVLLLTCLLASFAAFAQSGAQAPPEKQQVLWQKLENSITQVDQHLDGVVGVAVLDLTDGHKYLLHANDVFPQASSIKITVLAELYRQAQQGKLKLTDSVAKFIPQFQNSKVALETVRGAVPMSDQAPAGGVPNHGAIFRSAS